MYVKHLKKGDLYRPKEKSVIIEYAGLDKPWFINGSSYPKDLNFIRLFSSSDSENHPTMIYLGYTRDEWSVQGYYKHHWFLMAGRLVLLSNQSVRYLENLNGD